MVISLRLDTPQYIFLPLYCLYVHNLNRHHLRFRLKVLKPAALGCILQR